MQRLFYYKLVNAATQQTIMSSLTCYFRYYKTNNVCNTLDAFLRCWFVNDFFWGGGLKGSINFSFEEAYYVLGVSVTVIV